METQSLTMTFDTTVDDHMHYAKENDLRRIPKNTTLIGEIEQFLPIPEGSPIQSGRVVLKNGTVGFISLHCNVLQWPKIVSRSYRESIA